MGLNLVFGADNLHHPLTGIGRYAFELASRLEEDERVSCMRYFSLGRWIDDPLSRCTTDTHPSKPHMLDALRARLTGSGMAASAYASLSPVYFKWVLRKLDRRTVFHAPNFFVLPSQATKVVTVHDLSHEHCPQFHPSARVQLMSALLPESLRRADHIITVSDHVRTELMARHDLPADRVTTVHLAASDAYHPHTWEMLAPVMAEMGLRQGAYSLFVGTVEPRKNVERLVQAYELLPRDIRHGCPLVVAGGKGWNSEAIHARMARAQSDGWLRYMSFVDQRSLPGLYAGARLMVYPSLYEGFGLPIVEAMASGTPVLTSSTSCMPEVAAGAARLVDPLDVEAIAAALEECLSSDAWLAGASARGLARAAMLSWDKCAEQTMAVYSKLQCN